MRPLDIHTLHDLHLQAPALEVRNQTTSAPRLGQALIYISSLMLKFLGLRWAFRAHSRGQRVQILPNSTGAGATMTDSVKAVQAGGDVVVIGHHPPQDTPSLPELAPRGISVVTTYRQCDNNFQTLRLLGECSFDYCKVVSYNSERFPEYCSGFRICYRQLGRGGEARN